MSSYLTPSVAPFSKGFLTIQPAGFNIATNTTTYSRDIYSEGYKQAYFFLNVTAISGTTATLDNKIQGKDPVSGNYVDIPLFVFLQCTLAQGAQIRMMTLRRAGTTVPGVLVLGELPPIWRWAYVTAAGATCNVTFSLSAQMIK